MVAISVVSAMDVKSGIYVGSGITKGPTLCADQKLLGRRVLGSRLIS
jgi:hypothetical protein